jgi:hypothetical protein
MYDGKYGIWLYAIVEHRMWEEVHHNCEGLSIFFIDITDSGTSPYSERQ